jgi:hypothetical protein
MIHSVAEKRSIVRTSFLWKRWSGRQAATWFVIPAPYEVVILADWAGVQGALYTGCIQDDQKVSVQLMITIQKVTSNVQSGPASLQTLTLRTVFSKILDSH